MNLQDYTTEELKAEIKRRQIEERKARSRKGMKAEYAYAEAVITYINGNAFARRTYQADISESDCMKNNIPMQSRHRYYLRIDRKVFNKSNAPKVGDVVKLKSRKTQYNPDGFGLFCEPIICEIIKRNNK